MKANSYLDSNIRFSAVGDSITFPDEEVKRVIFKDVCEIDSGFLTQIQLINIKKNGQEGKLTAWLKFNHHTL